MKCFRRYKYLFLISIAGFLQQCSQVSNLKSGNKLAGSTYYTLEDFKSLDKIDAHFHINSDADTIFVNQAKEDNFRILNLNVYKDFENRVQEVKSNVIANFTKLKSKYNKISAYGSPAKATTSLNYFGITSKEIDYIVEDNILKHGKILPGVKIPIYSKEKLNEKLPDIIIVMAWNFFEDIKKNNQELIDKGVKFISIKDLQNEN